MKEALQEKERLLGDARAEVDELNKKLQEVTHRLELANKELDSFSYSVSHDLRAPLRAINGNAEILEEDFSEQLDGAALKYRKRIRENAARMEQLISDLLSFSRIGRKTLRKTQVDVNALVTEVFASAKQQAPHSASVNVHSLPEAYADYELLQRVWTNLISNAIKFSARKEHPSIEVGAERSGDTVTYYIRDNGTGFDMAYADKLFGTFQRLHDATEFEGAGMGLAIAQRIIRKHGGTIRADAAPDSGATFRFTLGKQER